MRKDRSPAIRDIEKPHPTVADSIGDDRGGQARAPLTVRLGGLWSDLVKSADQPRDPNVADSSRPPRGQGSVPLLDDMTGILQWD
jgi:hypothetical protein